VLLLTSDHEGLPTVVLEAMALGVPVVARAVGGIPEVIEHGVNGVLVDSADARDLASACVSVLESSAARERMVGRAQQSAQLHSSQQNAAEVLRLYSDLVRGEP
jgi:glycosyltransferase involved in cell wall biosynthesis